MTVSIMQHLEYEDENFSIQYLGNKFTSITLDINNDGVAYTAFMSREQVKELRILLTEFLIKTSAYEDEEEVA